MTITLFFFLLSFFAALTALVTEGIKNTFLPDIEPQKYSIVAVIVSLVIGLIGCFCYYQLNNVPINLNNVIFAILMGLASALVAMTGYDKVHDLLKML